MEDRVLPVVLGVAAIASVVRAQGGLRWSTVVVLVAMLGFAAYVAGVPEMIAKLRPERLPGTEWMTSDSRMGLHAASYAVQRDASGFRFVMNQPGLCSSLNDLWKLASPFAPGEVRRLASMSERFCKTYYRGLNPDASRDQVLRSLDVLMDLCGEIVNGAYSLAVMLPSASRKVEEREVDKRVTRCASRMHAQLMTMVRNVHRTLGAQYSSVLPRGVDPKANARYDMTA